MLWYILQGNSAPQSPPGLADLVAGDALDIGRKGDAYARFVPAALHFGICGRHSFLQDVHVWFRGVVLGPDKGQHGRGAHLDIPLSPGIRPILGIVVLARQEPLNQDSIGLLSFHRRTPL